MDGWRGAIAYGVLNIEEECDFGFPLLYHVVVQLP
jgi:hypothetical protein